MKSGIYFITNTANGSGYIGSAYNLHTRWHRHKSSAMRGVHHNIHFQNAWNKYGEDSFKYEIVEYCSIEAIEEREQFWLDMFWTREECGVSGRPIYNICREARICTVTKGLPLTEERKKKISEKLKGREFSEEHRAKIGLKHKGRVVSEEQKKRQSDSMTGRTYTYERKVAHSLSHGGKPFTLTNGVETITFYTQREASRYINCSQGSVCQTLKGKYMKCKGWWLI